MVHAIQSVLLKNYRKRLSHIFKFVAFSILCLLIYTIFKFNSQLNKDSKYAIQKADAGITNAQKSFSIRLKELMSITDSLSTLISTNKLDSTGIHSYLSNTLSQNPDVFGFGVGFEPYAYDSTYKLWAPFYIRPNDSITCEFIEDSYDYTTKEWYTRPLHGGAQWFDPPYIGQISQKLMAEYSVPIYKTDPKTNKKTPYGLVYLDYTLEDLTKAVQSLDLGKSGYGFMFSKDGTAIAHPVSNYIKEKMTIEQFAEQWKNPEIVKLFHNQLPSGNCYLDLPNPNNERNCHMLFKELPEAGWKLGAIFVEDAFETDVNYKNRRTIVIICLSIGLVLSLICLWLTYKDWTIQSLTRLLPIASIFLLLGIVSIGISKINQPYNIFQQQKSYPITEKTVLQKFIHDQDSLRSYYNEPPLIRIPTGVFIKHIEFDGSHNIKFSGIIWQKFSNNIDTSITKPDIFFFDNAPDAEAQNYKRIYTKRKKDHTVVGWYFRLEMRERLNYDLYPFDRENIRLSIGYPDLSQPVQLVPDLEAYHSINPAELPGIDQGVVLPEWNIEEGYFDYKTNFYKTDFGVFSHFENDHHPGLYFNLVLRRKFFWPFMTNIIPLSTISILLFLSIISIRANQHNKPLGFNGFGFIELCTAFLFVAILTHIDLRSNVMVNYVIYMDYFYFHIYLTIIGYSIAAVNHAKNKKHRHFTVPKLLYWPLLLGSLFIFTAVIFY